MSRYDKTPWQCEGCRNERRWPESRHQGEMSRAGGFFRQARINLQREILQSPSDVLQVNKVYSGLISSAW